MILNRFEEKCQVTNLTLCPLCARAVTLTAFGGCRQDRDLKQLTMLL